jgi:hypothetical protein
MHELDRGFAYCPRNNAATRAAAREGAGTVADNANTQPNTSTVDQAAPKAPRWRRILVVVLVVVGCVLAPISVIGLWARNTLLDTNQYVDTVGPLAKNDAIRDAVSERVSRRLVESVDIEGEIEAAFPRAESIAPSIASGFEAFVREATRRITETERFQEVWENANRRAHSQVVAVLEGEGTETVETRDGKVVINVSGLTNLVKQQLGDRGVTVFERVERELPQEFVLFDSEQLTNAQAAVRILKRVTYVLPILALLAFAVAIALSPNRRRTLLRAALGLAFGMALLLIVFSIGRNFYLDAIERAGRSREANAAAFDQVLGFLRLSLRTVFVLGLVVALGAWLAGPGRLATRIREGVLGLVRGKPGGEVTDVGRFVYSYRVALRVAVIGLGLLILVVLSHPGPIAVIVIAVLILVALLLIEFLGRAARATGSDAGASADTRSG